MGALRASIAFVFRVLWAGLDGLRKVLHLILLLFLALLVVAALTPELPRVPTRAALVVKPEGALVEQLAGGPLDRALSKASGDGVTETLTRDLIRAIEEAADDERIGALLLRTDLLAGGGLSKLQSLAAAVEDFRSRGKTVVAYGNYYSQGQYYLAVHADEVYMHPYGVLYLDGFARYRAYYREALDKLSVDWHVFSVGEYKSAAEPYERSEMSPADRTASRVWLDALWQTYREDVARARGVTAEDIAAYVSEFVPSLAQAGGDLAQVAAERGLVDGLWTEDQVRARMIDLVGASEDEEDSFSRVDHEAYLAAVDGKDAVPEAGARVGVIVAAGTIIEGRQPPGTVGAETLIELIHSAREDEDIRAVVLRIDSGGGSRFASELIRRELELLRDSGKPVIASMGSVAASGGYWISLAADQIWASPTTLTGSIGVVAMLPTFQRSLARLGINVDGVGTTELSGAFRPDRGLSDAAIRILELATRDSYRDFIDVVAQARGLAPAEVETVAEGRVWTGFQARDFGLVDELGEIEEAIAAAAALAGLETFEVDYLEPPVDPAERVLASLFAELPLPDVRGLGGISLMNGVLGPVIPGFLRDWQQLAAGGGDPRGLYMHCFCGGE